MKEFKLHDGEDDELNDALHDFLSDEVVKTVDGKTYVDWEGENNGIILWFVVDSDDNHGSLFVNVGDIIVRDDDGDVTIRKETLQ